MAVEYNVHYTSNEEKKVVCVLVYERKIASSFGGFFRSASYNECYVSTALGEKIAVLPTLPKGKILTSVKKQD